MNEENEPSRISSPRALCLLALAVVVAALIGLLVARDIEPRDRVAPNAGPPSVLFILVDTLRADYLGAYGFDGDISPNFDGLAAEGFLFENAVSQAPWTKPSIASLFTSLHPEQHGVTDHEGRFTSRGEEEKGASALPHGAVTLAESFRDSGYETAAFVANPWVRRRLGFAQGFETFDGRTVGNVVPASLIFEKVLGWFAGRDTTRPFFAYIHLMDVHGPYQGSPQDHAAVTDSPSLGPPQRLNPNQFRGIQGYLFSLGGPRGDSGLRQAWRASYAAGVRAFDAALGDFLQTLEEEAIAEDFILVITSDHGEELVEHGAWGHGDKLYEEQLWVPLLIRLPDEDGGGRRVERVVSLIDLMPTLLSLAEIESPPGIAGNDLTALLRGGDMPGPAVAFASGVKSRPDMKMVRTQNQKLIAEDRRDRSRLFDLSQDPGERRNLAETDPDGLEELKGLLVQHQGSIAGTRLRRQQAALPPAVRDKLRALGYLQEEPPSGGAPGVGNSLPAVNDQENKP